MALGLVTLGCLWKVGLGPGGLFQPGHSATPPSLLSRLSAGGWGSGPSLPAQSCKAGLDLEYKNCNFVMKGSICASSSRGAGPGVYQDLGL